MGKGDKKSKKGKLWRGSYGNKRNRAAIRARVKKTTSRKVEKPAAAESKPKKTARKKADKTDS